MWHPFLLLLLSLLLVGCSSNQRSDQDIPLPMFTDEGPSRPTGVYAVIRRADVPLDQSTDDAWSIINEQIVPPVTRGIWRGNGLRIGLLQRDQLDRYAEAMPQPVAISRMLMNRSPLLVPIVETARLRSDVRFEVDLTRPPKPRHVEMIKGGDNSSLRLLARIETLADGRHTLVLTPQHHIPSPLNLIPRDPHEKEMDGRVFDELSLRVALNKDQIAVVGLYYPWPMGEVLEEDEPEGASALDRVSLQTSTTLPAPQTNDPAAPPAHLRELENALDAGPPSDAPRDTSAPTESAEPRPRVERVAPVLEQSLGRALLTGTRIRQPVRSVLLITIEEPEAAEPALPQN